MQKQPKVQDKYYLKSVHEEIGLYDRKLAHMNKYEVFACDADRVTATRKMNGKRELLVQTALRLTSEGIEFKNTDLPRSFRAVITVPEMMTSSVLEQDPPGTSIFA